MRKGVSGAQRQQDEPRSPARAQCPRGQPHSGAGRCRRQGGRITEREGWGELESVASGQPQGWFQVLWKRRRELMRSGTGAGGWMRD